MNPMDAESKGWMVSSWQDPEEVPFLQADGKRVLLFNDGSSKELER